MNDSTLFFHVIARSEGITSGEVNNMVKKSAAPAVIEIPIAIRYFNGYPPIKQSIKALNPISAAVEKFCPTTRITVAKIGIQRGKILSRKRTVVPLTLAK